MAKLLIKVPFQSSSEHLIEIDVGKKNYAPWRLP
jgi:hypothetical protein